MKEENQNNTKKEIGPPECQWSPEELGFNFKNNQTKDGVETVIKKEVEIPSLDASYSLSFSTSERYVFEVKDAVPEFLSRLSTKVDIDTIKREALESFEKEKAEVTMSLIEKEYRDRDGLTNDKLYLSHIEIDTLPKLENVELDKENNSVKADVTSSFFIVDEYNKKNLDSYFERKTSVELPVIDSGGNRFEIDYDNSKYDDGIKSYMESFNTHSKFDDEAMNEVIHKTFPEDDMFLLNSSLESHMSENGMRPEPEEPKQKQKQKKSRGLGMSM